jgi:hypothetical protein
VIVEKLLNGLQRRLSVGRGVVLVLLRRVGVVVVVNDLDMRIGSVRVGLAGRADGMAALGERRRRCCVAAN